MSDGRAKGARKRVAAHRGMTLDAYDAMLKAGMRWCTPCKKWHKKNAFGLDANRPEGLSSKCIGSQVRTTDQPGARERRLALAKGLKWCSRCRSWLPVAEVSQGKCREHRNEAARQWYSQNSALVIARKNARARGVEPVPVWWREDAFAEFDGFCAYGCGRPAEALDHITPVARGGISEPANMVPACKSCNSRKRDSDPAPWVARGFEAFPSQWFELAALAQEIGRATDWAEVA